MTKQDDQELRKAIGKAFKEYELTVISTSRQLYRERDITIGMHVDDIMQLIHSDRERAVREAGRHYDAMFQALIDVIGYEPARAIKDGIEASGLTTKEEDNGNKLSHTIR